jgi:hypothetical protein
MQTCPLTLPFAESVEHDRPTDAEANHCAESGDDHQTRAEVKVVGENRCDSEAQTKHIEPQRSVNGGVQILAQAELHEQCRKPNRGDNHECQRTRKGRSAGIDDDQPKCQYEQRRRKNTPPARFWRNRRVGIVLGQGVSLKLYSGESRLSIPKTGA